jgi:hypothetical protein
MAGDVSGRKYPPFPHSENMKEKGGKYKGKQVFKYIQMLKNIGNQICK